MRLSAGRAGAATAALGLLSGSVLAGSSLVPAAAAPAAGSTATLIYQGATIGYPAGWPVYDLTADPTRCVRLDRAAVYLGHPGADQRCPAHPVGRTTALLVEPRDAQARVLPVGADAGVQQALSANGRVLLTASYGAGGAAAARTVLHASRLATTTPTPTAAARATTAPDAQPAVTGAGSAFDTCAAPSLHTMHVWSQAAPYHAVGVYIGGVNRACAAGNLSADWIRAVHGWGLRVIPTYVGRQASCSGTGVRINDNPGLADTDGRNAAADAVSNARALGLAAGSTIYLDLEQYDGDAACRRGVVRFVNAWVQQLHHDGLRAGVYTSNFTDLVSRHDSAGFADPDAIWISRWNGRAGVYGDPVVPDRFWAPHRRLHQYRGPHDQRHGGITLNIDTDYLDGPVS